MKFFRIKPSDQGPVVVPFLEWQRFDGTAYVAVGGTSISYLSISPLFEPNDRTGRVQVGSIQERVTGGIELIPQGEFLDNGTFIPANEADDDRAFVVLLSGAYDFEIPHDASPHSPRDRLAAHCVVLNAGDSIRAMPRVRNLRDWDTARAMELTYHGSSNLTFAPVGDTAERASSEVAQHEFV
ncbi:MAG: hypothetical protein SGJ27_08030 [Candidatus Melainabacteria bacterium]|nr:hypothetical protein [Candidatus Melainabacteria bacterium]